MADISRGGTVGIIIGSIVCVIALCLIAILGRKFIKKKFSTKHIDPTGSGGVFEVIVANGSNNSPPNQSLEAVKIEQKTQKFTEITDEALKRLIDALAQHSEANSILTFKIDDSEAQHGNPVEVSITHQANRANLSHSLNVAGIVVFPLTVDIYAKDNDEANELGNYVVNEVQKRKQDLNASFSL